MEVLERNGLRISRQKTGYLMSDFDGNKNELNDDVDIHIGDQILHPQDSFRYLGSMIHKSGRIDEDVTHRIKVGWLKWRASTGVLCDKKVPFKLKGKFFKVAIRHAMLYGSERWPLTKALEIRMEGAQMRMLRENLEVGSIINKLKEERLRWFDHVMRRPLTAPVRRVEALTVDGVRKEVDLSVDGKIE
ncbi:uncharacterized protein [Rutidosis leptorrhynchoides]|uniref:uncharacterized protein n=1 Tax=Rutidosis leptorrhynchoides TaxID=125765 RepID=UPI003A99E9E5